MALQVTRPARSADGRTAGPEELELRLLLEGIYEHAGYDFRGYAPEAVRDAVRRRLRAEGLDSVSRYQHRILRDRACLERLLAEFAPPAKALFDPPPLWRLLRRRVVPRLRTYPTARAWVAGCSTGEEAYSLAILLREEGLGPRSSVYATELDETRLDRAREGRLSRAALEAGDRNLRRAGGRAPLGTYGVAAGDGLSLGGLADGRIVFSTHSLATDASFNEFHLILCRDLLPRFAPPLRSRVLELLHDSLGLFGFLAIGPRDSLRESPLADRYESVGTRQGLYRRIR